MKWQELKRKPVCTLLKQKHSPNKLDHFIYYRFTNHLLSLGNPCHMIPAIAAVWQEHAAKDGVKVWWQTLEGASKKRGSPSASN